jgi:hypothetical protein
MFFYVTLAYLGMVQAADKFWARFPYTKTRKIVHINMCPETFNL